MGSKVRSRNNTVQEVSEMPSKVVVEAVLNALHEQALLPSDLIKYLVGKGVSESDVKEAVAQLLHDQDLELSTDRLLHVNAVATGA
jgi:hypothetical protein